MICCCFFFLLNDAMCQLEGLRTILVYWIATVLCLLLGNTIWPDSYEKCNQMLGITLQIGLDISSLLKWIREAILGKVTLPSSKKSINLSITNISLFILTIDSQSFLRKICIIQLTISNAVPGFVANIFNSKNCLFNLVKCN